jgi:D-mannonate dehydratase
LRNISAPLRAGFVETCLDDGYMNMARVVRTLHESAFNGAVISDRYRPGY